MSLSGVPSNPETTHLDFTMQESHQENLIKSSLALSLAPHPPPGSGRNWYLPRMRGELQQQLKNQEAWDPLVTWAPIDDNIRDLLAILRGPAETPYENGVFFLRIHIPQAYPGSPPIVKFLTKVHHPNIDMEGRVCVNILDTAWSPILGIDGLLTSVLSLLSDPNIEEPLLPEIAVQYSQDRQKYEETVRNHTKQYATQRGVVVQSLDQGEWWQNMKVKSGTSSRKAVLPSGL